MESVRQSVTDRFQSAFPRTFILLKVRLLRSPVVTPVGTAVPGQLAFKLDPTIQVVQLEGRQIVFFKPAAAAL